LPLLPLTVVRDPYGTEGESPIPHSCDGSLWAMGRRAEKIDKIKIKEYYKFKYYITLLKVYII